MELSEGGPTRNERLTSWSSFHPNWKKKFFVKSFKMLLWKEAHNKRERGRKKESLGGLFLQRIIAEVTDNMVHKETANLG